jgi:hypothetical protein
MQASAQHARQEALLTTARRTRGRLRSLPTSSASHQTRTQSTLIRLVSILEAHVTNQLVKRLEPHAPPPRSPVLDDIYITAEDKAIGSWPAIINAYQAWFGVKPKSCADWNKIQAMLDARNAIAHGMGELTRRQTRKDLKPLISSFSLIGINVIGTRLDVSEVAIRKAAFAAKSFVGCLDALLSTYDAAGTSVPNS